MLCASYSLIYCFYAPDSFCLACAVMMGHSPLNITPLPVGMALSTVRRQHERRAGGSGSAALLLVCASRGLLLGGRLLQGPLPAALVPSPQAHFHSTQQPAASSGHQLALVSTPRWFCSGLGQPPVNSFPQHPKEHSSSKF